jgi:hypothetical protein
MVTQPPHDGSHSRKAIVAQFPVKIIPTITGEPDYDTINQMVQTLYGIAASCATILEEGTHRHISNRMTPPLYVTLTTNTPYETPIDPGALPIIPPSAPKAVQEQLHTEHYEEQRVFDNHLNMDNALKAQVINTIQADNHLYEMQNEWTRYLGVTTHGLLNHLLDQHSKITPATIKECKSKKNEPTDQAVHKCIIYAVDSPVTFLA